MVYGHYRGIHYTIEAFSLICVTLGQFCHRGLMLSTTTNTGWITCVRKTTIEFSGKELHIVCIRSSSRHRGPRAATVQPSSWHRGVVAYILPYGTPAHTSCFPAHRTHISSMRQYRYRFPVPRGIICQGCIKNHRRVHRKEIQLSSSRHRAVPQDGVGWFC